MAAQFWHAFKQTEQGRWAKGFERLIAGKETLGRTVFRVDDFVLVQQQMHIGDHAAGLAANPAKREGAAYLLNSGRDVTESYCGDQEQQ